MKKFVRLNRTKFFIHDPWLLTIGLNKPFEIYGNSYKLSKTGKNDYTLTKYTGNDYVYFGQVFIQEDFMSQDSNMIMTLMFSKEMVEENLAKELSDYVIKLLYGREAFVRNISNIHHELEYFQYIDSSGNLTK